jgi:hypothetical protein
MRMILPLLLVAVAASGCAVLDRLTLNERSAPVPAAMPDPIAPPLLGVGKMAATLDTTTSAEKEAALAIPPRPSERSLGQVTASLGSPAEQGFWLRTTLVTATGKGRVATAGGQSVAVDLMPGTSGAQLSLAAFRALGLSLTALPEVAVFAR